MTATVKIDLSTPQAVSLVDYLATLPFAEVKKTKKEMARRIPPCQYTEEEVRERAMKADADIASGRFIFHEDIPQKAI